MKRLMKKASVLTPEQYIENYPNGYQHIEKGVETINVDDIIGMSYSRASEYDDNFQPIGEPDDRWKSIYERAQQEGNVDFAKPISLVKVPNENKYFIWDDGNHRLSVAKNLSISTINANIIELIPKTEEVENKLEEIMTKIRELNQKLTELNIKQQKLYDSEELTFEEIDIEFDKIEEEKQPLLQEVDNLWIEHETIRSGQ